MFNNYKTLKEVNDKFEEELRKQDDKQFGLKEGKNIHKDGKVLNTDLLSGLELDLFLENWINEDGWNKNNEYVKESYYRKILSNSWDFVLNWSINTVGNQHFAITINMPLSYWFDGKHIFNYDELKLNDYIDLEMALKNHILNGFNTVSFLFLISEKNENNILHFHILLGVKNFIDYNYTLKNNLLLWLKEFDFGGYMNDFDIKVDSLLYFKDVKNWSIYM